MLDKLGGVFAPRPSTGPHKLRESLPLVIFLRNRLKYALTNSEVTKIVMQRLIKVDGKVRTDSNYPAGFMGKFFVYKYCFVLFLFKNLLHVIFLALSKLFNTGCGINSVKVRPILTVCNWSLDSLVL